MIAEGLSPTQRTEESAGSANTNCDYKAVKSWLRLLHKISYYSYGVVYEHVSYGSIKEHEADVPQQPELTIHLSKETVTHYH